MLISYESRKIVSVQVTVFIVISSKTFKLFCNHYSNTSVLDIKVLGWLPFGFGCPQYNFSCPVIIQTAEIQRQRFRKTGTCWFLTMKNRTVPEKKRGLAFLCANKFRFTHCFAKLWNKKPQRLSLTPLPIENNSHGINLRSNGIGYILHS